MFRLLPVAAVFSFLGCLFAQAAECGDVFAKARKEISEADFRVGVASVTLARDAQVGTSRCTVVLGAQWRAGLSPLLIQQGNVTVEFAKDASGKTLRKEVSAQGPARIVGRSWGELRLQVPAPPRSSPQIDVFRGHVTVTTASKMLDFQFDSLKLDRPAKQSMEGVTVTLDKVTALPDRLSVELAIDNPKGTPNFETFLTSVWLENNKAFLAARRGKDDSLVLLEHTDDELLESLTPLRARVRYHFKVDAKTLGKLGEWRLLYKTPGPIVEVVVPFELKDIALP